MRLPLADIPGIIAKLSGAHALSWEDLAAAHGAPSSPPFGAGSHPQQGLAEEEALRSRVLCGCDAGLSSTAVEGSSDDMLDYLKEHDVTQA